MPRGSDEDEDYGTTSERTRDCNSQALTRIITPLRRPGLDRNDYNQGDYDIEDSNDYDEDPRSHRGNPCP